MVFGEKNLKRNRYRGQELLMISRIPCQQRTKNRCSGQRFLILLPGCSCKSGLHLHRVRPLSKMPVVRSGFHLDACSGLGPNAKPIPMNCLAILLDDGFLHGASSSFQPHHDSGRDSRSSSLLMIGLNLKTSSFRVIGQEVSPAVWKRPDDPVVVCIVAEESNKKNSVVQCGRCLRAIMHPTDERPCAH